jgi:predicted transcriptional regulator
MSEVITVRVPDGLADRIEKMADHHSVSNSVVIELLIREGLSKRDLRLRLIQLDAKIDHVLGHYTDEEGAKEQMEKTTKAALELPETSTPPLDLEDTPAPIFQSLGVTPDDWEGAPIEEDLTDDLPINDSK